MLHFMNKQSIIISIIITLALLVGIFFIVRASRLPGQYDSLAQCLVDKGITFYGAFWCPHCQSQKALFGKKSEELLPYVECSTPNGGDQTQVCIDAKIEGYPTWEFPDPIIITSETDPIICSPKPGKDGEGAECVQSSSAYATTWIFPQLAKVVATENQIIKSGVWTFPALSRLSGEVSLEMLAEQSGCNLK